jgi:nucleotide-binding universal stress UspA family protein
VCVDGSPGSEAAFMFAAKATPKNDEFVIATGMFRDTSMEAMGVGMSESRQKMVEGEMERLQDKFGALCKEYGRKCHFETIDFTTVSQLGFEVNTLAERNNARSVLVGSRGYGSFASSVIMGSVSNSIMHQCNRPVTIVRPPVQNQAQ